MYPKLSSVVANNTVMALNFLTLVNLHVLQLNGCTKWSNLFSVLIDTTTDSSSWGTNKNMTGNILWRGGEFEKIQNGLSKCFKIEASSW